KHGRAGVGQPTLPTGDIAKHDGPPPPAAQISPPQPPFIQATRTYVMGRKRSASKKAKISAETPDSTMAPQEELETSNVFSHDMDTLECEICSLPFDSQIFMCKNGHAACGNCCIGMTASAPAATSASATSVAGRWRRSSPAWPGHASSAGTAARRRSSSRSCGATRRRRAHTRPTAARSTAAPTAAPCSTTTSATSTRWRRRPTVTQAACSGARASLCGGTSLLSTRSFTATG
uniref:Uncharacterized protein n=1 Tax=Aegilops tauschii subsp. strangulata TaxID=200361 RepID=A0A453MBZ4_AEGTS